jgi:hypothetical protein
MKFFLLTALALGALTACYQRPASSTAAAPPPPSDSAAIADAIHGFYRWYGMFSQDSTHSIDFTDDRGDHLALNQTKLEHYYGFFKKSGFVSDEFIAGEYAFYKQCSLLWQQEPIDEVSSCMDADKYFCAQDWELSFWTTAPIRFRPTGKNRVLATLYGTSFDSPIERTIALKKENGRWLITTIECDMGLGTAATGIQLKPLTLDERYMTAKMGSLTPLTSAQFARLELNTILSDSKRKAPGARVYLLDTLLVNDRGKVIIVGYDSGNETEAWMIQYGNTPKILFWDQVYYADQVEYIKTVTTTVSGNQVTITTGVDSNGTRSSNVNRYELTNQLIFERNNTSQ